MQQNKENVKEWAQPEIKVFKSKKDITINISAEKLWGIIGPGFVEYDKWATIVDRSTGKGKGKFKGADSDERICLVNGQGPTEVTEKILQYSDVNMNLSYEATQGMPEMMAKASNEMTVVPGEGNKSNLFVNMEWGVHGPLEGKMSRMMEENQRASIEVFLNDIKVFAETGSISESKQLRLDELAKM
jgi:hypothetical protein